MQLTELRARLKIPVIAAPMLLVSNPDLVIATCRAGAIGTFPSLNQRSGDGFEAWLDRIEAALGPGDAPFGVNLIVGRVNDRLAGDLAVVVRHAVPLVITSFGADRDVVAAIHGYGGFVFHDVASPRHIEVAAAAGVDGLILLTAGAGGHTGWHNPFAMLNEARARFGGALILAGALSTGRDVAGAITAGADFAYMGTRFIATREANVDPDYQRMIVDGSAADVTVTRGLSGTAASFLDASMRRYGLVPEAMAAATEVVRSGPDGQMLKPWAEIWSAGQGIGSIADVPGAGELVERLAADYAAALRAVR